MQRQNSSTTIGERWVEDAGWRIPAVSDRDDDALAVHTHSAETARRCRIVLLALEGWSDAAIADHLGVSTGTVTWWKYQFATGGIAGLIDRSSAPRPTASPPRLSHRGAVGRTSPHHVDAAEPPFSTAPRAGHENDGGAAVTQPWCRSGVSAPAGGWALRLQPALEASTVELIGAYVSRAVQVAGLLEVPEAEGAGGRRAAHVAAAAESTTSPTGGAGLITCLSERQPVAHQLGDFLRQLRRSAPGRRLHVVTDNAAAFTWLRSLRSRHTSTNLVPHLAVDSRSWLNLMDVWMRWHESTTEGGSLADTIQLLHGSGRRFRWLKPSEQLPGHPPTEESAPGTTRDLTAR